MTWFEEWFDTPLYYQLYAHRDTAEAGQMADLIEHHFPPSEFLKVLDLACGRGRHSINMARKGYRVTGVDLSPNAIKKAQQNIPNDLLIQPEFRVHDMREHIDESFDLVINLFTSFGYFEQDDENALVIERIAEMLNPGGGLVLDFLNPTWVRDGLVPAESHQIDDYTVDTERFIKDGMVHKVMTFKKDDSCESQTFRERVKLFEADWFLKEFSKNGLILKSIFGSYEGEAYQKENSSRMIFFAEKAGQ